MAEPQTIRAALAGNPNAGKTTLFNRLTGARHHVANYPGVTVETRVGRRRHGQTLIEFTDLPGTYGLTTYSPEEVVARDYLIHEKPDVVVDVVDASNLERNLYLAVQLMELGAPLVLALNMSDVARERGYLIDAGRLSQLLGTPCIPTVATRGEGLDGLNDAVVAAAGRGWNDQPSTVHYGREIEEELATIESLLAAEAELALPVPRRWAALKLLEGDNAVRARVKAEARAAEAIEAAVARSEKHLKVVLGCEAETAIADRRYGFISGACMEAVKTSAEARHDASDRIDAVLTHPFVGPLIFIAMMFGVFYFVFALGDPLMGLVQAALDRLGHAVGGLWPEGSPSDLRSLLVDGVIGGVGAVVVFLPNIMLLFLAMAFLEDSGYMARAAFIMDSFMHRLGLHGKSFIPMLIGFGCSVPAIMATRTLEDRRDRLTTILVLPFISCSARLPIYMMILPAFFPRSWQAPLLWLVYIIGIAMAVVMARLLKRTLLRGETEPFVIELPPYRMPTLRGTLIHMWERSWHYLKKAGTIILLLAIIMWSLSSYPKLSAEESRGLSAAEAARAESEQSFAGRLGRGIAPVMRPLGFDWRITTALVPTFAAKEAFVTQMGIVFSLGDEAAGDEKSMERLQGELRRTYPPLVGLCIVLFCLLTVPCMATLVVAWRESGHWGWALLQLAGYTAVAYVVTLLVYQVGSLLGLGTHVAGAP